MTVRMVDVRGKKVEVLESGSGEPVLYLHDMWDLHTAQGGMFTFHEQLAAKFRLLAPAHPGCGESDSIKSIADIDDLAFHYLDVLDALGLQSAAIVGTGLGGWVATEIAVRNPERVSRLALVGAAGLQMPGAQIADIFMYSQHRDGGIMRDLRNLLFGDADSALANSIVPDGRVNIPDEVRRYKSLTLAGRVGWEPPYLHDRKLLDRLHRITAPALLIWGEQDRFVPLANGRAYAANLPKAALKVLPGVGHSAILEAPEQCMALIAPFLSTGALP